MRKKKIFFFLTCKSRIQRIFPKRSFLKIARSVNEESDSKADDDGSESVNRKFNPMLNDVFRDQSREKRINEVADTGNGADSFILCFER